MQSESPDEEVLIDSNFLRQSENSAMTIFVQNLPALSSICPDHASGAIHFSIATSKGKACFFDHSQKEPKSTPDVHLENFLRIPNSPSLLLIDCREYGAASLSIADLAKFNLLNKTIFVNIPIPEAIALSSLVPDLRFSVRISKFENAKSALSLQTYTKFAYVDRFAGEPMGLAQTELVRAAGFYLIHATAPFYQGAAADDSQTLSQIIKHGRPDFLICSDLETVRSVVSKKKFTGPTQEQLKKQLFGSLSSDSE